MVQTSEPVYKYPEYVTYIVKQLGMLIPSIGKIRKAHLLARCGTHLSSSFVQRIKKDKQDSPTPDQTDKCFNEKEAAKVKKTVIANYPDHVWHADLTTIPT